VPRDGHDVSYSPPRTTDGLRRQPGSAATPSFFGFSLLLSGLTISEAVRFISLPATILGRVIYGPDDLARFGVNQEHRAGARLNPSWWRDCSACSRLSIRPATMAHRRQLWLWNGPVSPVAPSSSGLALARRRFGCGLRNGWFRRLGRFGRRRKSSNSAWKPSLRWSVKMHRPVWGRDDAENMLVGEPCARYWSIRAPSQQIYGMHAAGPPPPRRGKRQQAQNCLQFFIIATGFSKTRTARARKKVCAARPDAD